jgi:hypothetical protein
VSTSNDIITAPEPTAPGPASSEPTAMEPATPEPVRRQSIWDRRRRDLVEDAAHLTADFKRRSFGVASGDFGLCLV